MGEVYLAEHGALQRHVAIKRFLFKETEGDDEETARERFYREGQALARLSHHNVVGVHDLFEWRKQTYMVLEYVDGFDLSKLLAEKACPVDVASLMALGATRALEAAHAVGIIHRDVKASNVMLSRRGEIKLMDFGIARQDLLEPMTRTGLVVGTPRYVAPEVVKGGTADARSDVYGVGALMYFALSGQRLFSEATQENLFHLILVGKYRSLGKVARHVPRELRRIVRRCLERDPARRYGSATELALALEGFLARNDSGVDPRGRLVAFLKERGHFSDAELEEWQIPSGSDSEAQAPPPASRSWWKLWAGATAGALLVVDAVWFGVLGKALEMLTDQLVR